MSSKPHRTDKPCHNARTIRYIIDSVRERDNNTCQLCGDVAQGNHIFPVHHVHYDEHLCFTDLITLCDRCHAFSTWNRTYFENVCMQTLKIKVLLNWMKSLRLMMFTLIIVPVHCRHEWEEYHCKCSTCPNNGLYLNGNLQLY